MREACSGFLFSSRLFYPKFLLSPYAFRFLNEKCLWPICYIALECEVVYMFSMK